MELWQGEVSIEFELRAKTVSEMGPWAHYITMAEQES